MGGQLVSVEGQFLTSEELVVLIVVVAMRLPSPGLGALCMEVMLAILVGGVTVVDGPIKASGNLGCVAIAVIGDTETIGVEAPVSTGRTSDTAPEEEARARLAGDGS